MIVDPTTLFDDIRNKIQDDELIKLIAMLVLWSQMDSAIVRQAQQIVGGE